MSNRVVHFEIPCDDPGKTMDFFKQVFGWKFEQFGTEEYWSVITGEEDTPGINGGIMRKRDSQQPVANSIEVVNIDRSAAEVEKAGGTIVVPKCRYQESAGWLISRIRMETYTGYIKIMRLLFTFRHPDYYRGDSII